MAEHFTTWILTKKLKPNFVVQGLVAICTSEKQTRNPAKPKTAPKAKGIIHSGWFAG
jgi:hypothetical protein